MMTEGVTALPQSHLSAELQTRSVILVTVRENRNTPILTLSSQVSVNQYVNRRHSQTNTVGLLKGHELCFLFIQQGVLSVSKVVSDFKHENRFKALNILCLLSSKQFF